MDFIPLSSPTPEMPKHVFNVRMIIIAILILMIIVGIIFVVRKQGEEKEVKEVIDVLTQNIENNCSNDSCALSIAMKGAKEQGNVHVCEALSSKNDILRECIWQYAYDKSDPGACTLLVNDVRVQCENDVHYRMALENRDIASCARISDASLQSLCGMELLPIYIEQNTCDQTGLFADTCKRRVDERIAFAKTIDARLCEPFAKIEEGKEVSDDYILCTSVIDSVDLDGDGLMMRKEFELGTDNQNRDSDGDGYDDGTEVRGGYNPLGQ